MDSEQTETNSVKPTVIQPPYLTSTVSTQYSAPPQPTTLPQPPVIQPAQTPVAAPQAPPANVVTIPVPIVHNEGTYAYVTVKGSLHDRSCSVFGLNDTEVQALSKRFENSIKPVVNGVMVSASPMTMMNTLAQLSYKVICSSGEAEICWTMQREI